jgi:hypothetical protein
LDRQPEAGTQNKGDEEHGAEKNILAEMGGNGSNGEKTA